MSSLSDYNELFPVFKALSPEKTGSPNIPVDVLFRNLKINITGVSTISLL
jgi:hypothetical protein